MKRYVVIAAYLASTFLTFGQQQDWYVEGYPIQLARWELKGSGYLDSRSVFEFKNISRKNILAFKFEAQYIDIFGEICTEAFGDDGIHYYTSDIPLIAGETHEDSWSSLPCTKYKLAMWKLSVVVFEDGTIWKNENGRFKLYKVQLIEITQ